MAFLADLDGGGSGIFTGSGGPTTTVALTSGPPFSGFRRPSISAAGVCFNADLDAGGSGIFTGPDAVADKIIAIGDPLFGSTVTNLHQDNQDFNDSGQAVFRYGLADGRTGLAVATPALQLTAAVSRKMHDGSGPFDINLPLTGAPGVECRSSGGIHTLVLSFTNNVVSGDADVTTGTGVAGSPSFAGKTMTVSLSGVTDVQKIIVTLSDVTDDLDQVLPDTAVSVNMLIGDTTGNKAVNSSDIGQTKSKSGQATAAANFRTDVTVSGSINASDIGLVKSRSGFSLP